MKGVLSAMPLTDSKNWPPLEGQSLPRKEEFKDVNISCDTENKNNMINTVLDG